MGVRVVLLSCTSSALCLLPMCLIGALAVELRRDLAFTAAALGLAVATYRASAALLTPSLGRLVDRIGPEAAMRIAALVTAVASAGLATIPRDWLTITPLMVLGGAALAFNLPAANRLIMENIPPARLGRAFGLNGIASPAAAAIAGLSVPVFTGGAGWRWAFGASAILSAFLAMFVSLRRPRRPRMKSRHGSEAIREYRWTLLLLAAAFGMGTMGSATVTTFYVDALTQAGGTQRVAGLTLALASFFAILSRVGFGTACDYMTRGYLMICVLLLGFGAAALFALATNVTAVMVPAAAIALAGTWGFNAVLWFTVMRSFPGASGTVSGRLSSGALVGTTLGPLTFGLVVEQWGYSQAWLLAGCSASLSALLLAYTQRRLPAAPVAGITP